MKFFVYILYNVEHDKFYIGQTNNLKRRIEEHNDKTKNKFTSKYTGRWILVYKEEFFNRKEAQQKENFLKRQKNKNFYKNLCRQKHSVG